jgi:hypothetical protein
MDLPWINPWIDFSWIDSHGWIFHGLIPMDGFFMD